MTDIKSIDDAIEKCEKSTIEHKKEASRIFRIIIFTLIGFLVVQSLLFYQAIYNKYVVSTFKTDLTNIQESIGDAANNIHQMRLVTSDAQSNTGDGMKFKYFAEVTDTLIKRSLKISKAANSLSRFPDSIDKLLKVDNTSVYIIYGIFILIFGVLTSFYRYHLKEVSKFEHFLFGFQRIRIAGNNSSTGYDDEVKTSLSKDAFIHDIKVETKEIKKQIESPIPGHPTSDIATALFNKILESVEVTPKAK